MKNVKLWRGMAALWAMFGPFGAIAMYLNRRKCDEWSWIIFVSPYAVLPVTLPLFLMGAEDLSTAINWVALAIPFGLWAYVVKYAEPQKELRIAEERRETKRVRTEEEKIRREAETERRAKLWEDEMIGEFGSAAD